MKGPKTFLQVLKDFTETKNPVTRSVRRTILKNRLDRNAVEEIINENINNKKLSKRYAK